ncbi:MAG TPA: RHS repeat protein [Firmicutes bacterium]|nr:RHS repeat protein [Bacillota bacterium]
MFEDYYKEYVNLSNQLAQMDRQMPVNYLTDGEVVKGYNADGRLVAVMDNYENTVAINYDNQDRIESVVDDNDRAIVFTYNPQGRLASLTDQRGRKTRYYYDGEGRLTTVRSGARWIKFKYNTTTNDLEKVWSSDMLQTDLVYTDSKLTKITQSSVGAVNGKTSVTENDSGITGAVSCTVTQIEYPSETKTVVTQDTNTKEYYLFNDLGNKSQYCLEEYGKVTKAEKYDYVAYVSDKTSFAAKDKLNLYAYTDDFDFGTEDYEEATLDEFNNPVTSTKFSKTGGTASETVVTTYEYDDEHRCVKADASVVIGTGNSGTKTYSRITEYAYNSAGKKVRTESYIEGEEAANGKSIEEAVYDAKGHLVKSFKYNSLDTSSKFYTESVYAEDGTVTAEKDETGEASVEYEYIRLINKVAIKYKRPLFCAVCLLR